MDGERQQPYIPAPPSMAQPSLAQPSQSHMMNLPPPPPRPQIAQSQGMMIPPPPGRPPGNAFGTSSNIPPNLQHQPSVGWQQNWGRQGISQGFPPPPPPLAPSAQSQNQHMMYGRQPAPPLSIPRFPYPSEGQPLTSATYIPVGDSLGPGVGIPPLADSQLRPGYDSHGNAAVGGYRVSSNQAHDFGNPDGSYRRDPHIPPTPPTRNVPSSFALHDDVHELNTTQNPPPQTATQAAGLAKSPSHRYNDSNTSLGGLSSSEASVRWPLDRVLLWLAQNAFSLEWQETFKALELQGADFLELGHGSNGRGNLGRMHKVLYPQLAKECAKTGTGWDQAREREEGLRMRKLIRQIHDDGSHDIQGPPQKMYDTQPSPTNAVPEGIGGSESSPQNGNNPVSVNPKNVSFQHGPGFKAPQPGHIRSRSAQLRSVTLPFPGGHEPTLHGSNANDSVLWPRSEYSTAALSGVGVDHRRQSPSTSSDNGVLPGHPARPFEDSPKSGSPAGQPAYQNPATDLGVKHNRGSSTDSLLKYGRSAAPGTGRYYEEARKQAQDGTRASPHESYSRQWSGESLSSYSREHRKGFLNNFFKRGPKPGDSSQPSPEEQYLDSPTSPVNMRHTPHSPYAKPSNNISDVSLGDRPSSASMSDHERLEARPKPARREKRWIMVTMDGINYRLVDVTSIDSVETLRAAICQNTGISDWTSAQIFLTEPGQVEHEEPLNDTSLALCRRTKSDSLGSLKMFVQGAQTHLGASNASSNALGASLSDKTAASPITGPHQLHRKPLDEEALSRISPLTPARPGSPTFPARQSALRPPALKPHRDTSQARSNASPVDMSSDPDQLLDPQKADLLARHEEHLREVERKQQAYRISKVPHVSHPTQNATYGEPGYRRKEVIDFDSRRASPYEDKKADTLVPFRKPPSAPNDSNTLKKVNSLSKGPGDRPAAPQSAQAPGLGAALARMGRMTTAIGTPGPSSAPGSATGSSRLNGSATAQKSPDELDSVLQQFSAQSNPEFRDTSTVQSPAQGAAPEGARRPSSQSRKSYGPEFDFEETEVSFQRSPNPQDDSDDSSDDGLFAKPIPSRAQENDQGTPDGSPESRKRSGRPSLTLNTGRQRKGLSVSFRSPSTAGEPLPSSGDDDAKRSSPGFAESPEGDKLARRKSFARGDIWASRPTVEGVIDNLDDFFPNIDLDAPYFEGQAASPPPSPANRNPAENEATIKGKQGASAHSTQYGQNDPDVIGSEDSTLKASEANAIARRNVNRSGGLSRMKSIREVAKGAHQTTRTKSVTSTSNQRSGDILRRKSTKMFGAKIMQISPKPGSRLGKLDSIPQQQQAQGGVPQRQPTFRIVRGQLIGKGTYGRVYLGINADNGEVLAVKQVDINPRVAGQDRDRIKEMVAAMDQEIDTMQHLEHPNIVQYLGCERGEYSISIYLEYISGGSIGSCLRKHGKFEESVVKSLTRQTLSGLAYLHDQGILHRDLKADNILLDLDGSCKISDFGISKKTDDIYGNDSTNSMQGSVFWMAPEVIRSQGQGYSAKVDIWSLGCVVLEMFAGRRPWSREEAIGAIFKLGSLNQAPPIPEDVSDNISPAALGFMWDCLTVDSAERPTATTLLKHQFCEPDPKYDFLDTELYAKIRHVL